MFYLLMRQKLKARSLLLHGEKWMFNYGAVILSYICSTVISKCSTVISKILISAYFNILDITAEYLEITTKHIRWLFHS